MKVIIAGAAGRMGRELLKYAHQNADIDIIGASEESSSDWVGKDIGEVIGEANMNITIVSDILELIKSADVIIDFTNPETTLANAVLAAQARISHIIGTTGFQNEEIESLKKAGNHAVLVQSGNMSLGINILSQMTEKIARTLSDFDIEITEIKVPSICPNKIPEIIRIGDPNPSSATQITAKMKKYIRLINMFLLTKESNSNWSSL